MMPIASPSSAFSSALSRSRSEWIPMLFNSAFSFSACVCCALSAFFAAIMPQERNIRWEIGREYVILKANGRTKKFKKYMDDDKTDADIDKTTEKEFLRVDWRMHKGNVWFHVSKDLEYY